MVMKNNNSNRMFPKITLSRIRDRQNRVSEHATKFNSGLLPLRKWADYGCRPKRKYEKLKRQPSLEYGQCETNAARKKRRKMWKSGNNSVVDLLLSHRSVEKCVKESVLEKVLENVC